MKLEQVGITKEAWVDLPSDQRVEVLKALEQHQVALAQKPLIGFKPNGAVERLVNAVGAYDFKNPGDEK